MTFKKAIEVILKHEGGYVDDPIDPGGETNMGISRKAYPHLDIKNLTKADVVSIYFRDYWEKAKCAKLPNNLQLIYFDMVVNMGKRRAVKILQEAINAKGVPTDIDGGIGPQTIGNAGKSKLEESRLRAYRLKYYASLVLKKPKLEKYYYGWCKRALEV
jgi:lysozyme family protein|tara:strand:+ start:578 stop:1054 length:477 start_codon:yes stop_codon:yes gene_type:complete